MNADKNTYDESDLLSSQSNTDEYSTNTLINAAFTESEVRSIAKKLKNNKAHGTDLVLNEFIKCTIGKMCPIYVKLFNLIMISGYIPDDWAIGIIVPIYKNKSNLHDPNNYRGITLLSCICKVLTSILTHRLYEYMYVDNFEILGSEQACFRHNHSTTDHTFVLYSLIELYCKKI